jgi:hypothetical protein
MKAITLKQPYNSELEIINDEGVIWIDQLGCEVVIDKEFIPELIKILESFILPNPKQNGKAQRNNPLPRVPE